MKEFGGWFFPDNEQHLVDWLKTNGVLTDGRLAYQWKKLSAATSYCRRFRNAVDCGAHVGTWTYYLAKRFTHVHCFEPVLAHRECFTLNITQLNVTIHPVALGEASGGVEMYSPEANSSGSTMIRPNSERPNARLETLDSFDLDDIDLIKLDCEGSELFALRGGEETIKRCKPVIICEQKPGRAQRFGLSETGAVTYLQSIGYKLAQELSGDFILVPL